MPKLLTSAEVARRLRVTPNTLRKWRYFRKHLPFQKYGACVRYFEEDVIAFETNIMVRVEAR